MKQLTNFRSSSGFTLIEMLISISIFMIFLAMVSGSYTTLISANRSANATQKIYQDVRNVLDTISDEVRNGKIDFSCGNFPCGQVISLFHDNDTKRTLIKFDEVKKSVLVLHQMRSGNGIETSWVSQEQDWQPLNSEANPVEAFSMRLFPEKDPYESINAADDSVQFQPSIGITLTIKGYTFKTTYSSRTYGTKSLYL